MPVIARSLPPVAALGYHALAEARHDRLAVGAQLHVELHATDTERSSDLEACQRVLRRQGPAAAMGDHGG